MHTYQVTVSNYKFYVVYHVGAPDEGKAQTIGLAAANRDRTEDEGPSYTHIVVELKSSKGRKNSVVFIDSGSMGYGVDGF